MNQQLPQFIYHIVDRLHSIYIGEVAIGLPLYDPNGILDTLKAKT